MANCPVCKNRGIVVYQKIKDGIHVEFGARCTCEKGTKISNRIPSIEQLGMPCFKMDAWPDSTTKKEGLF